MLIRLKIVGAQKEEEKWIDFVCNISELVYKIVSFLTALFSVPSKARF
jgi:hypothetical protein